MPKIENLNIIFKDEQGTDLNKYGITEDNGLEKQVKLRRLANITQKGTPLNAQNLNSLKDKINEVVNKANTNETEINNTKQETTTKVAQALQEAKTYTDSLGNKVSQTYETKTDATAKLESAKSYSDTNKQNAITSANTYTDNKVKEAIEDLNASGDTNLGQAKAYTDQKVSDGVKESKKYTDTQIGKINSDLVLKVECDHAVEITGQTNHEYNLAIPEDSSVVITKIQGHTGIKSPNLIQFKPGTYGGVAVSYDSATGIHTFNGTSTGASIPLNQTYPIPQGTKISFIAEVVSGTKTSGNNDISIMIDGTWIPTSVVATKTLSASVGDCWMGADVTFKDYKVKINVLEGTYTNDTMPIFRPQDKTFANSNNILISTGRNLVDVIIPTINASEWKYLETTTLLKGRYFVKVESDNNEGSCLINIGSFEVYSSGIKYNTAYWFDVKGSGAQGQIQFYSNTANTNVKVQIRYTPTGNVNFDFEPYKEDTITSIGSLGEFDYILPQSNQRVRQTSQVVTLNGSENWSINLNSPNKRFVYSLAVNAIDNPETINVVSNNLKEVSANDTYSLSQEDNLISATLGEIQIVKSEFTTVDQLKQWLTQNPIQLVYKLATPTYENVSVPSGYKVSNGGMQLQKGDVPYTLYKEYAVSLKSQVVNNSQINVQQQAQINELESKSNDIYNKSEVDKKVEDINTNLKNKQDKLNRDSNVEVYSIKATTLNGRLISNLGQYINYFTYTCTASISGKAISFTFITNTQYAPKNEKQWQWLDVLGGSGAISDTGSNINAFKASILKQGIWFMFLEPSNSSVGQSFNPKFFKCTDVRILSIEDMFGNRYNTEGQIIS